MKTKTMCEKCKSIVLVTIFLIVVFGAVPTHVWAQDADAMLYDGMTGWDGQEYKKLQVTAAQMGVNLTLNTGYEASLKELSKYDGIIVMAGGGGDNEDGYGGVTGSHLIKLRSYVKNGGRLCVMSLPRISEFNETIRDAYKVMSAKEKVVKNDKSEIHMDGGKVFEPWEGLTIGSNQGYAGNSIEVESYFVALSETYQSSSIESSATGEMRSLSVVGNLGEGTFAFISSFSTGGGGIRHRNSSNLLTDKNIEIWENKKAAQNLLRWLVEK